jgi:hypothetical protein
MFALPARSVRALSRLWVGRLSAYRNHQNDEHREALIVEALRIAGLVLENELSGSRYWSEAPLARRVAVLLYLVDRGAVIRTTRDGRIVYEVSPDAEAWVASQTALAPYLTPTLEMLAALRNVQARRAR